MLMGLGPAGPVGPSAPRHVVEVSRLGGDPAPIHLQIETDRAVREKSQKPQLVQRTRVPYVRTFILTLDFIK